MKCNCKCLARNFARLGARMGWNEARRHALGSGCGLVAACVILVACLHVLHLDGHATVDDEVLPRDEGRLC